MSRVHIPEDALAMAGALKTRNFTLRKSQCRHGVRVIAASHSGYSHVNAVKRMDASACKNKLIILIERIVWPPLIFGFIRQ